MTFSAFDTGYSLRIRHSSAPPAQKVSLPTLQNPRVNPHLGGIAGTSTRPARATRPPAHEELVYMRNPSGDGFLITSSVSALDNNSPEPVKVPVSRRLQQLHRKLDESCLRARPRLLNQTPTSALPLYMGGGSRPGRR